MLSLKRAGGQWIEVTHRPSGDVIRICTVGIKAGWDGRPGTVVLLIDDRAHCFDVLRDEAKVRGPREGERRA